MDRVRDHVSFAVRFAGLGYVALWPWTVVGPHGVLFGAPLVCRGGIIATLCALPHPLMLSPGLHLLGAASAFIVVAQGVGGLWRYAERWRARAEASAALAARLPLTQGRATPRVSSPPVNEPMPRAHFGLRGPRG